MDVINDYIEPVRLTGMIRTALRDLQVNAFKLARWLPNVNVDDVVYKYLKGQGGLTEASVYRSFDAESPVGRREGISEVMGSLPPISEKIPLGEYERLRLRQLRDDSLLPFIARDAQRLARNIAARLELARGDAIFNGSVTINENGVVQTVSFGRAAGHAVTASTLWSDHNSSVPIDDLISWCQTYVDDTGEDPATVLMPKATFWHLQQSAQIKGRAFPTAATADASLPTLATSQVSDVLTGMGLPRIELYDAKVKVDGASTRITPLTKIALLPAPGNPIGNAETALGGTFLGTTAESLEPEYGLAGGDQAGVVAAQWKTKDPVKVWTHAAAIALPVLTTPDLSFVATVL